jgi:6-phosphogluconolactonase
VTHEHSLIIGAYTEELPHVKGQAAGILGATYDPATGRIRPVIVLARTRNPSYVTVSPAGGFVYAVNETAEFAGQSGGGVTAFARDPRAGTLTELNSRTSSGDAPCHLAISQDGRFLLVANYESGSVTVIAIEADGSLGREHAHVQHAGSSVNPERQAGPHAHMAYPDPKPGSHDVFVTDLGQDAVLTYELTDSGLTGRPLSRFSAPPGAGPRHLAFHPDGQHVFLVCELGSIVLTLRRDGGRLVLRDATSTLPPGGVPGSLAGAVRVTPSGRHVLVSNRGHDSIAMLAFDPAGPSVTLVHSQPSVGAAPRDFCLTPEGNRLIVAHQDGHSLVVMQIDEDAPSLRQLSQTEAPSPSSVAFAP